ncbi:hypothetical protein MSG28_005495 [Choristoneura fumiferana]|uniref:Uncharacterized protein n=1 Tax=Choristoneura fumiferana TaxID=7141 RepID=A0ACC0L0A8_CHOFU|nr:hypothetical protein MSG28_005495 [Choristoneura fumiferana]
MMFASQGRAIIASVYHFLKEEFEFTKLTKEPNWDITHLQNISRRTAEATGNDSDYSGTEYDCSSDDE